ncbi:MAG: site-specific DNA-methyltransferase [Tissierellia bacterium]|nr:site-specific DNA-methyltransferase [Tissierellia bacterium]
MTLNRENMGLDYIINLDCLEALRCLPDNFFDCCITSPPYYGLRDYGEEKQIGREKTPMEYINKLIEVFSEVRRVLKKEGTCWIVISDCYAGTRSKGEYKDPKYKKGRNGQRNSVTEKLQDYKPKDLMGIPWQLALNLREDGWYLRSDIIWHKENSMPESAKDRPSRSYEHIFLLTKSRKYYYDYKAVAEPIAESSKKRYLAARGKDNKYQNKNIGMKKQNINNPRERGELTPPDKRNKRDLWTINTTSYRGEHYAVFPTKLAETCMLAGSPEGGIILDPFMGSGTVGLVAKENNRHYIGIEINKKYCDLAKERIEKVMR